MAQAGRLDVALGVPSALGRREVVASPVRKRPLVRGAEVGLTEAEQEPSLCVGLVAQQVPD